MGLLDLREAAVITIETPGGSFAVRGINLVGLVGLITRNRHTMPALFDSLVAGQMPDADQAGQIGFQLLASAPNVLADIIATGAGEYSPDTFEVALNLPAPAQIEAIEAIAKLTFLAEGGPKKFMETVIRLAQGTASLVQSQSA